MKKIEKALPQPFPLPNNHSKIVMEGLSNDHLIGRARSKFVSEIATSIMFYKNYPSLKEYNDVAKQITIQYPQLKSREGKGHVCFYIHDPFHPHNHDIAYHYRNI